MVSGTGRPVRFATKDTYLAAQYARLVGRRGKAGAGKAVGHPILVAAFHILAGGVP